MRAEIDLDLPQGYMSLVEVDFDVVEERYTAEPYSWGGSRREEVDRDITINTVMGKSPKEFETFFGREALRQVVAAVEGLDD